MCDAQKIKAQADTATERALSVVMEGAYRGGRRAAVLNSTRMFCVCGSADYHPAEAGPRDYSRDLRCCFGTLVDHARQVIRVDGLHKVIIEPMLRRALRIARGAVAA